MATASESSSYGKLRRSRAADCLLLSDLPNGILEHTASFLSAPSKALFAVALDENKSASLPNENERSSAIVGNQWEVLDFGEVEKELAEKLSDYDIEKVLLCIDAVNKVKKLKFTNCVNITGAGFEPLRGSTIIEQIDLSLVGDGESPYLYPEPPISRDHVLPILHSIIEREGCALKYLQFPKAWGKERSFESAFHHFLQRYNEILESRGMYCVECSEIIPEEAIITSVTNDCYALQNRICYGCLEHYCYDCANEDGIEYLGHCNTCDKDYCARCVPMVFCENCDIHCTYCTSFVDCCTPGCVKKGCAECVRPCLKCNRKWCEDCKDIRECDCCHKLYCVECLEEEGANAVVKFCDDFRCFSGFCEDCRLLEYQQGNISCSSCIALAFSIISDRAQELKREVDQLKDEVKDLKDEVKDLKDENKRLRTK
jgi:hypothetical protein